MGFKLFLAAAAVISLAAAAVLAARFLGCGRLRVGRLSLVLDKSGAPAGEVFTRRDGLTALAWGVGVVCLTYGVSLLYCGIFGSGVSWSAFCDSWRQYDAYHYLGLAREGYAGYTEGGRPLFLVFFPLYPWLIRLLHLLIPDWQLCGHLISALCYVGSCCLMARLATEEFGRRVGRLSLAFLTAYPFAFFFCSVHTESLFLLLSLAAFYFIRRGRYPLAGVFGALAALTRMQGVFLAVVAFAQYCVTEHPIRKLRDRDWAGLWRDLWGKLFWMAVMGLGTLTYLLLNWHVAGDPFSFTVFQRERWYQGSALFTESLTKLWNAVRHPSAGYEFVSFTTWGPQLVLFVFCLAALVYGVRRLPPVWSLYYLICVFLNYSLSNPLSCCRYIACAFPLPVILAMGGERRPAAGRFLLTAYGVLQGVFLLAYLAGRHVC